MRGDDFGAMFEQPTRTHNQASHQSMKEVSQFYGA